MRSSRLPVHPARLFHPVARVRLVPVDVAVVTQQEQSEKLGPISIWNKNSIDILYPLVLGNHQLCAPVVGGEVCIRQTFPASMSIQLCLGIGQCISFSYGCRTTRINFSKNFWWVWVAGSQNRWPVHTPAHKKNSRSQMLPLWFSR